MPIIGSQSLLRRIFIQVADGNAVLPSGIPTEIPLETITASQHSFYLSSVVQTDLNIVADVFETTGALPGGGTVGAVNCAILKRRSLSSPDTLDIILYITSAIDQLPVKYRVYKFAGLD